MRGIGSVRQITGKAVNTVKPVVVFGATRSDRSHEIFLMDKLESVYEARNDPSIAHQIVCQEKLSCTRPATLDSIFTSTTLLWLLLISARRRRWTLPEVGLAGNCSTSLSGRFLDGIPQPGHAKSYLWWTRNWQLVASHREELFPCPTRGRSWHGYELSTPTSLNFQPTSPNTRP
jgi:hypothetical protein